MRGENTMITWAGFIRHRRNAVTCPWEVWEKLPDGRECFLAAYQTFREAEAAFLR